MTNAECGVRNRNSRLRPCRARLVMHCLLASSFILHPSSFGWAAHPFITDDAGTQGKGNWQLELQGDFLRDKRTADTGAGPVERKDRADAYTSVLSYGILENLDVQVGISYLGLRTTEGGITAADASGMSDSTLELKWRFYEADEFSLALKPGLLLPTGDEDKGLGTGKTSWGIALLATYEAEPWTFLGNIAYTHARFKLPQDAAESRGDLWRVSGGASYALTGGVRVVGELGLRANESRNDAFLPDSTSQFGMLGVIYSPTRKIDLDTGFRKNFNRAESDKAFLVGATFRW
jgi:outer membrane putative beta-barrel porin/alpha-amylase